MNEESIDERNSMQPPYRYHDIGSVLIPVPEDAMRAWTDKIQALLDSHKLETIDIWRGIA